MTGIRTECVTSQRAQCLVRWNACPELYIRVFYSYRYIISIKRNILLQVRFFQTRVLYVRVLIFFLL